MTQPPVVIEEATLPAFDLDDWEAWHASAAADAGIEDARASTDWRAAVSLTVLLAALLAFTAFAFEGPVAQEWYNARQARLAAEFAAPHGGVPIGGPAAQLVVQKPFGLHVYVVQGDGPTQLRGAPGHRVGTPLPGAKGNSVVMGHREGWGGPFGDLNQLKAGYRILTRVAGQQVVTVFTVQRVVKVDASDTHLLASSTDHRLTLVTAAAGGKRLMVVAISGTPGKLSKEHAGVAATTPGPALLFDMTTAVALLAFAAGIGAVLLMAGRFRAVGMGAVVVPLVAAGLFCALMGVDRMLTPLR